MSILHGRCTGFSVWVSGDAVVKLPSIFRTVSSLTWPSSKMFIYIFSISGLTGLILMDVKCHCDFNYKDLEHYLFVGKVWWPFCMSLRVSFDYQMILILMYVNLLTSPLCLARALL